MISIHFPQSMKDVKFIEGELRPRMLKALKKEENTFKRVTARVFDTDHCFVRVRIPTQLYDETTPGKKEIHPGVYRMGTYKGKKWGVVYDYSTWSSSNSFTAYDLNKHAEEFEQIAK